MQTQIGVPERLVAPARRLLDRLVQERLPDPQTPYAYFWVTREGSYLPGLVEGTRVEERSGYVIDALGRISRFWLGWQPGPARPGLLRWVPIRPPPDWDTDSEYQDARRRVGLTATPRH